MKFWGLLEQMSGEWQTYTKSSKASLDSSQNEVQSSNS